MKKTILLALLVLMGVGFAYAQNKVTGTVTSSDDGSPLPFVTIVVKGTTSTATSDVNGNYSVTLLDGASVLVFSFAGMTTEEVEVGGRSIINVVLSPDAVMLDDAVVVSYGVVAKGGAPFGAKATVQKEKLAIPVSSIDKALQGNAAGVVSLSNSGQPGAGQQVTIRGVGSISGGTTPLYVVDGMPIAVGNYGSMTQTTGTSSSGDNFNVLSSLNSNDIESVTILKDAAATSIYGSRASNGVVLITTKAGKAGKTQFNLKLSTGFSSRTTKNFELMNKDEYLDYITEARVNAGYSAETIDVNGKQVNKAVADLFRVRNANKDFYDFDWAGAAYNDNAPMYSADFSASGGNEKTKFYASLSYLNQDGTVIDTHLKRYSGRINLDHEINKNLKFGVNTLLSYTDQRSPMTTGGYYVSPVFGAAMYAPIDVGIIEPGSYLYNSNGTFSDLDAGPNIDYMVTYANANFLANSAYDDFSTRTARNVTNGYIQWSIIDGLILKGSAGIDYFYVSERDWRDGRPRGNSASYGHGYNNSSVLEQLTWNETITLNYLKSFDNHNINILLGQEAMEEGYRNLDAAVQDFLSIPGQSYPSSGATPYSVSGTRVGTALSSLFASANYNYLSRYYVSASIRTDGSSRLSKDNRWSTFWSVGGSWKISNESFMQDVDFVNSLQLRASYGTTGSTAGISRYASQGLYASAAYNGNPAIYPSQIENPNLTWQTVASFDIGVDATLFDGKLGATIDFYRRNTKDMLLSAQLSRTSGFTTITSNLGELYNQGIEIEINSTPVRLKNFVWGVDLNFTSNKNRITKLNRENSVDGKGADVLNSPYIYREGEDLHSFYLYRYAGVNPADGRPMYYDSNGEIIYAYDEKGDSRQIVGAASPDFYGGLTTKFSFYGVDISAMFYYTYGNDIYDSSWGTFTSLGQRAYFNQHKSVVTERWRREGDIAAYPKAYYSYPASIYGGGATTRGLLDGSYIRLRDVTVGYTLPQKWSDAIHLNSVRVYAQASNLFTITKFPDADPEVGGGTLAGYYYLGYPNSRTITFGLDVKF